MNRTFCPGLRQPAWRAGLASVIAVIFCSTAMAQFNGPREPGEELHTRRCDAPPHPYSCAPVKPFLAFSFSAGDIWTRADRADFFQVLLLHYNTAPTQPSTGYYIDGWRNYRREVLAANPNAILGMYFSALTTQNPTNPGHYAYAPEQYGAGGVLLCATDETGQYDPRPDEYGFYAPRTLAERANWQPWGPGLFGRWPFYEFQARGWVLPQTTYLCRPIIDFRNSECVDFVTFRLQRAIALEQPDVNAIAFDNAAMLSSSFGTWPGRNAPLSPFRNAPPDEQFKAYLDQVRAGLHEIGARLIVNTGYLDELAPHADVIFHEAGVRRQDSAAVTRALILDYKAILDQGAIVAQRYIAANNQAPLEAEPDDLRFFLASSLLVYEPERFAIDPLMPAGSFHFYPEYFMLPSWLRDARGTLEEPASGVFLRRFENGVVLLNANARRHNFTDADYLLLGLGQYGAPKALLAKSAVIKISDCAGVTNHPGCAKLYQNQALVPPFMAGDLNCDSAVDLSDHTPFLRALLEPEVYAVEYPYCDRAAADMNADGLIDDADYTIFAAIIFHGGELPRPALPGDMNCDGYINNYDIDPFVTAILDPVQYGLLWPDCDVQFADLDGDGAVTHFDLPLFIELILD